MTLPNWDALFGQDRHGLIVGGTRRGKSALLQLIARRLARSYREGFTLLDLHGECARAVFEWLANPRNSDPRRPVHFLDPASSMTFGLNPIQPYDGSWEAAHDAALVLISALESWFDASPEETPRLARIVYVAAHLCGRKHLTLLELLELLTLGGSTLRESLLTDFENRVVRRELEDLHELALRSPARFLEQVESARNRFVRLLADRRLARILGQRTGLNPRRIMDGRDIVLVDLSSLSGADGAFLGTLMTNMYVAAAKRRSPLRCARHRLIGDEFESMICTETARLVDQCAKFGLTMIAAVQRFGQLRAKGPYIFDALMANTPVKIAFGGLELESARYMAESFFAGFVDLQEWKPLSARPGAVGQSQRTVHSSSHATNSSETTGQSRTRGTVRTSADATSTSYSEGVGSGRVVSEMSSRVYSYHDPEYVAYAVLPTGLAQGSGEATAYSEQRFYSSGYGASRMEALSEIDSTTDSQSASRGDTHSRGQSEVFVTDYEWMPAAMFSLEEQLHRLTAEVMNLPRRECFVKVEDQAPFRTRTADLTPAFRVSEFRRLAFPRYHSLTAERSPYLRYASDVDAEIAERVERILEPPIEPEPDFTEPEEVPILEGLERARELLRARLPELPGRPTNNSNLRIVDGGKDDPGKGDGDISP